MRRQAISVFNIILFCVLLRHNVVAAENTDIQTDIETDFDTLDMTLLPIDGDDSKG